MPSTVQIPTGLERIRIAAQAIVSERTVLRAYRGRVSEHSLERVRRAARELGLPVPEPQQRAA